MTQLKLATGKAVFIATILLLLVAIVSGYEITWWTIDGGGGEVTGGSYVLNGTVGQSDAGKSSGSHFTLYGGFWAIEPIPTFSDMWYLYQ